MGWKTVADATPPVGRPLRVRVAESDVPVIAFLAADGLWYSGGALVQSAGTLAQRHAACMVRARRRGCSLIGRS